MSKKSATKADPSVRSPNPQSEFRRHVERLQAKYGPRVFSEPPSFELMEDDEDDHKVIAKRRGARLSAGAAIMSSVLEASIPRNVARKLRHAQALAVVIHVPGPEWVEPVHREFRTAFGPRWLMVIPPMSRWTPPGMPDVSAKAAVDLSEGRCVAAICVGDQDVPETLLLTADLTVQILPPNAEVVRRAVVLFAGGPVEVEEGAVAGLGYGHLLACFRPGTGAQRIVDRVAKASRMLTAQPDERLPCLADAAKPIRTVKKLGRAKA